MCRYLDMKAARGKGLKVDWGDKANMPCKPNFVGTKEIKSTIEGVVDYIDWNPFFQVKMTMSQWRAYVPL